MVKWIKRGWLAPTYVSEDGKWEIFHTEFGHVAYRNVVVDRGWFIQSQDITVEVIAEVERKIAQYENKNYDHIT